MRRQNEAEPFTAADALSIRSVRQLMIGRRLCTDAEASRRGFGGPGAARRRAVLKETIEAFERAQPADFYHRAAADNLERWRSESGGCHSDLRVEVLPGDWGDVAGSLTRANGVCFAVLNMANAYVPGGAYVEGAIAQEENMFRRTDCHFRIDEREYDATADRYRTEMTDLLTARRGAVYLDVEQPRVCLRGPEDRSSADLGYAWLAHDEIFPFFELRAAARDLRDGSEFDSVDARRRIGAQLDTLTRHGVRHAVLSAFGCGAFCNPADEVAQIYREELERRRASFSLVAFAIFAPGYGPDNYTPFAEVFAEHDRIHS